MKGYHDGMLLTTSFAFRGIGSICASEGGVWRKGTQGYYTGDGIACRPTNS